MSPAPDFEAAKPLKVRLGKLADLLERSGINLDEVGRIDKVNIWQGFYKDAEGEAHTVDMAGITAIPTWADGPQWPVVQPAKPTVIRQRAARKAPTSDVVRTVILPDTQIGYMRYETGELEPIHDVAAMSCALEVARVVKPHRMVNLGDTFDLAAWSGKFVVTAEYILTTQPSIDFGGRFFAEQRAIVGEGGEVVVLGGNHDDRIPIAIARNAMEALRLKRANQPESWPVLSLPHLLHFDKLGIEYVGAYPAGKIKLADAHGIQTPLYARHGTSTDVRKIAKEKRQSFVQGHGHHVACHTETYEVEEQPLEVEVWSLGCLARLDGAVPSTKGGTDDKGHPFRQWESWQHAVGLLTEWEDGWNLEPIRIRDGRALVDGRLVTAQEGAL